MPKIEVDRQAFFAELGRPLSVEELEKLLTAAKAEIDELTDDIIKIELNDTNRPDLWSAAGILRLLRVYTGAEKPDYAFFSGPSGQKDAGERRIKVDGALRDIRPYVVACVADGKAVTDAALREIIQMQEKLCWNFGQKRRAIAMGVYRSDLIEYPVHYRGVDPDKTSFVPLGFDRSMSLREINSQHPKGQDYGHIVADFPLFPLLCDNNNEVLSYPPVINSARIGAVETGQTGLFIEMTGSNLRNLMLTTSIVACNLADMGFTISPVTVEYPFDTEFGREVTTPFYFQDAQSVELKAVNKLLGVELSPAELRQSLERMGNEVLPDSPATAATANALKVYPPPYRNDFLHSVDLVEDVMIGRGMDSFSPELPRDFTIGRLSPAEEFMRRVRDIMAGLGFQEMIFNYLGSARDYIYKMHPQLDDIQSKLEEGQPLSALINDPTIVQIFNPMSENHEFLRNSILPGLLNSESVSGNAAYPHSIFEAGKIACLNADNVYGTDSKNMLGFLVADKDAGLNLLSSQVATLFYYVGREYSLAETGDQRFIPGRAAAIVMKDGRQTGLFGEIHPGILENWGINMPVSVCEIDLDMLRKV